MASDIAAMGRAGTLRSLADAIRRRRERGMEEEERERQRSIAETRVPLPREQTFATEKPIKEMMGTKEMTATQQYEQTKADMKEGQGMQVRPVDSLPVMKSLEPYPSAYEKLRNIAKANNWIKEIGGVETISNEQAEIARGIIGRDIELRKDINTLALSDITQNIISLKQSLSNPKLKEEEKIAVNQQIESLTQQQTSFLNAINLMNREIQRKKAMTVPKEASPNEKLYSNKAGDLKYIDIRDPEAVKEARSQGYKPHVKDGKEKGVDLKEYRQWRKQAEGNAYRDIFINKPTMMQTIKEMELEEDPEELAKLQAKLHQEMGPEQRDRFKELLDEYMKETPDPIWKEHQKIKKSPRNVATPENPLGLKRK